MVDVCPQFKENVIDYFTKEYISGRTPNPCVVCNRYIKWKAIMEEGERLGAYLMATGHYAQIAKLSNGRYTLKNSITAAKDQTYALYGLTQEQLSRTRMPVGSYEKMKFVKLQRESDFRLRKSRTAWKSVLSLMGIMRNSLQRIRGLQFPKETMLV